MALGSAACTPAPEPAKAPARDAAAEPFELQEATVAELQQSMESGRRTARSIAELYLRRIDALDQHGPELRSIIERHSVAQK